MNTGRREFLAVSAGAAAAMFLRTRAAGAPAAAETFFDWQTAGDDAWAGLGEGGNSLVVLGKDGAVLVDCKNGPFGVTLRREAGDLGKPLKQVINTHHHVDHTGGNHAFVKDLPVLAHPNCKVRVGQQVNRYIAQAKEAVISLTKFDRKGGRLATPEVKAYHDRMAKFRAADFEPTQLTTGDTQELAVAGERIVLRHLGPGHTDNDLVVHFPARNLVHCGDLLFNKRHAYVDREAGANTRSWQEAVKKIIALCNAKTVVVAGHGAVTDMSALKEQIDYFDRVREIVAKAQREHKNVQDTQRIEPDAFPDYAGTTWPLLLRAVFEELEEEGVKK